MSVLRVTCEALRNYPATDLRMPAKFSFLDFSQNRGQMQSFQAAQLEVCSHFRQPGYVLPAEHSRNCRKLQYIPIFLRYAFRPESCYLCNRIVKIPSISVHCSLAARVVQLAWL